MGKIDKEKLLEEFSCVGSMCLYDVRKVIKNFPEEPEIDFDALLKQWRDFDQCSGCSDNCDPAVCIIDFLKSKNLTVPKLVDIPVKKTWTLKKEYQEAFKDFDFSFNRVLSYESEPTARRIKYYDKHEEPDYSKIAKGSIVVVSSEDDKIKSAEIVEFFDNSHIYCNGGISYELKHVKIRIVELAKE